VHPVAVDITAGGDFIGLCDQKFHTNNRHLLFQVPSGHNSVTVQNRTHVYMNFFDHKDLGNHLMH